MRARTLLDQVRAFFTLYIIEACAPPGVVEAAEVAAVVVVAADVAAAFVAGAAVVVADAELAVAAVEPVAVVGAAVAFAAVELVVAVGVAPAAVAAEPGFVVDVGLVVVPVALDFAAPVVADVVHAADLFGLAAVVAEPDFVEIVAVADVAHVADRAALVVVAAAPGFAGLAAVEPDHLVEPVAVGAVVHAARAAGRVGPAAVAAAADHHLVVQAALHSAYFQGGHGADHCYYFAEQDWFDCLAVEADDYQAVHRLAVSQTEPDGYLADPELGC